MPGRRDIVLTEFPFTDQRGAKLRPVLVLTEIPSAYRDFIVLFITSQLSQATPDLDIILTPSDPAFSSSGLRVASAFRIGKIASLSEAMIVGTLGSLDQSVFEGIVHRLAILIQTGRYPA